MTDLLSLFLYLLPSVSSFLVVIARAALRRRMKVLGKIRHEMPLPLYFAIFPLFFSYDWSSLSFLMSLLFSLYLVMFQRRKHPWLKGRSLLCFCLFSCAPQKGARVLDHISRIHSLTRFAESWTG